MHQTPGVSIHDHCDARDDPRIERTKRHQLRDSITIARCGVIGGADSWVELEAFGNAQLAWLRTFLAVPHGIPSRDTFGRVCAARDPEQCERCLLRWVAASTVPTAGQVVARDGKRLRRAHDRGAGKGPRHLVSAWATAHRLPLGEVAVDDKSNAITALPAVLGLLVRRGGIVTIDAMGCQTEIARTIVAQQADEVRARKGNQGTLHRDVADRCAAAPTTAFAGLVHDHQRTVDQGHGRIELRQCWTRADPPTLAYRNPTGAWAGVRSGGMVEAERRIGDQVSREVRYSRSRLSGDAREFGGAVRSH
jgi:predicted transposase YbfD/YdcC